MRPSRLAPLQSWPLAFWPDGSLKWTAHALPPTATIGNGPFEVIAQRGAPTFAHVITAVESDTGDRDRYRRLPVPHRALGPNIITSITRNGREALRDGKLVLLRQDRAAGPEDTRITQQNFESVVEKVTLEQRGPVRAVVKVEGKHAAAAERRRWLPFTLRFYFYAGSDALRVLHTIVFDGDESKRFHPRHRPAVHGP